VFFNIADVTYKFNGAAAGSGAKSDTKGPLGAGNYAFQAFFAGNDDYNAAQSALEPFVVEQSPTTTTTEIHLADESVVSGPVPLGSTVHDKATVVDSGKGTPTGDVTFTWYTNNTCEGTGTAIGTVGLVNGVAHPSASQGPLHAGYYAFKAHYNGDSNYAASTSACEPLEVDKGTVTLATTIYNAANDTVIPLNSHVALGTSAYDKATVTGETVFFNIADVTYKFNGAAAGSGAKSDTKGPLGAGNYAFQAFFAGNDDYNAAQSALEPFVVEQSPTTTTTEIHLADESVVSGPVPLGSTVHDKATVVDSGKGTPTGDVTFTWYTNNTCEGTGTAIGTVGLVNGVAHPSASQGPLHAGYYAFKAHYNGDSNYAASTSACEPLEVDKGTVTLATTIYNAANDTVIPLNSHVALGTSAYDKATFTGANPNFVPTIANVSYTFTNGGTNPAGSGAKSDTKGPLGAGSYKFNASFSGDANYNAAVSADEPFVVDKGPTTITTQVHDADHKDITNKVVYVGAVVHDSATVSGQVGSIAITGQVKYSFFTNAGCTGTAAKTETVAIGTESAPQTIASMGYYCYKAEYLGDANYASSVSAIEPFTVVTHSLITDTMLCTLPSNQFKLVFTPDQTNGWKLNASNPGQFYYNMFYTGSGNEDIVVTLPYPWVTQGAVPIHVYSNVGMAMTNGITCLSPSGELANSSTQVTLANYSPNTPPDGFGKITTVTIHVPALSGGFAYINIHLDYGLKWTTGYAKGGLSGNDAVKFTDQTKTLIKDKLTYAFSDTTNGTVTITSINAFKRDPGIGGLVLNANGDPVVNAKVAIYLGTAKTPTATVYTDEDGWYMWQYKWTGKAATFAVKMTPPLPYQQTTQTQNVTLKANGYLVVSFTVLK